MSVGTQITFYSAVAHNNTGRVMRTRRARRQGGKTGCPRGVFLVVYERKPHLLKGQTGGGWACGEPKPRAFFLRTKQCLPNRAHTHGGCHFFLCWGVFNGLIENLLSPKSQSSGVAFIRIPQGK